MPQKCIQNCVSSLVLRLQKVLERYIRKTYSLTTSHPAFHTPELKFGNIRKTTKNSNFKRNFLKNGWSYRREILHDNLEDQAQWHISKTVFILVAL